MSIESMSENAERRSRRRGHLVLGGGLVAAILLAAFIAMASLSIGARSLPLSDVVGALFADRAPYVEAVITQRSQRTALGLLVGAALGVSGAIIQGLTRNPLGDPGLLGVNSGAALSVVVLMTLTGSAIGTRSVWAAVPGGMLAALAVYAIGSGRRGPTPVRLALAGAALGAVLGAVVQAITLTNPATFDGYRFWVVGSLAGRSTDALHAIWPAIVITLFSALLLGHSLNALALGDEAAIAVGASAGRTRVIGAAVATVLACASTAAVGPIAFVGLMIPHTARAITGPDHRWLIPYSALLGATLLVGADIVGRVVVRPGELMVGVVTAAVGAPFLVAVVRVQARQELR